MPKKLFISDERMFKLMDIAIRQGLARTQTEYYEKIGFPPKSARVVKAGRQGFTREQIYKACKLTGTSADWIFGFTNTLKRKPDTKPIEQLKAVVIALEQELRKQ